MSFRPEITVAALTQRGDRFLMVEERASGRIVFNQPAGHLEDGESLAEAVIRETLEETAWRVEPEAVTGVYLWRNPSNGKAFLRVGFAVRCLEHDPDQMLDDGILRAMWISPGELRATPGKLRSPLVMSCIHDYLAGRRYPLDMLRALHLNPPSDVAAAS
ncbi:MAG: NUDIX hydrolase [Gammaproteobacteria bacterium]